MTRQAIGFVELTGTQANITFSNIPQDGTDLLLVYSLRTDLTSFHFDDTSIRVNNDSGANYSNRLLQNREGSVSTSGGSGQTNILAPESSGPASPANTFGNGQIYIPNYTAATAKTFSCEGGSESSSSAVVLMMNAGLWNGTAPITSIYFYSRNSRSFLAGSTATLYKITKGSDGVTTVS